MRPTEEYSPKIAPLAHPMPHVSQSEIVVRGPQGRSHRLVADPMVMLESGFLSRAFEGIGARGSPMTKLRVMFLGLVVWLVSFGLYVAAQAQSPGPTIHVHAVDPPESVIPETGGLPGLLLRATFSLLDANSTIMTADIENATLRLGGDLYSSKFSKLETEWSVVLLVDTSGTMNVGSGFNDFRVVRDSLGRAIGNAPESVRFALIPFFDRAPTAIEFTSDRDRLGTAIKNLRPQGGTPACLNDGLYEATAKLSNAPGRRAVIAITASADTCATRSTQNVVDFARQNDVELYAVGVDGYTITPQELESFALPSGGISEMRGASELAFALDNLMAVLGNQWQAVWVVYPPEGPQTAELSVKLPDGTVVTGDLSFESDRGYTRPPTVAIAGTAQSTVGGVRFNLDFINPERIRAIDVILVSKLTGRTVYQAQLRELTDSILLPSDELVEDGEYTLTLTALDEQGVVLSQTEPLDFRYEPLLPTLTATVQEWPAAGTPYFIISAAVQNLEGIANYRLWLEGEQGGAPVQGTEVTIPAGEELRLPVGGVRSGGYVVRVQALDSSDRVLVENAELKVAYQAPGAIARLVASLRGSTLAVVGTCGLGIMALVGLGALVVFLAPKRRGTKNVELALPEKARRTPRPAEPMVSGGEAVAPLRAETKPKPAAPAEAEPARPQTPRPVPPQAASPKPPPVAGVEAARPQTPRPVSPPPAAPKPPPNEGAEAARPQTPSPAVPPAPAPMPAAQAGVTPAGPASPPIQPSGAPPVAVPKPAGALAVVSVLEPRVVKFQVEIRKSPFRIGRAGDNDGVLPVDPTSGVSGHHCVITLKDGRWAIQDDQSRFGTTVSGQPIPKGQPVPLEDGAVLGLGPKLKIQFRVVSGAKPATPS